MKMLGEFIVEKQHGFSHVTDELTALLSATKLGAKVIHHDINKAGLVDILGASGAKDVQGEAQQKLDLFTNEKLKTALKACDTVTGIASEEGDEIVVFEGCGHARYVMLMDPLDGSSNIDVNVSAGTTFSIYRHVMPVGMPVTEEDSLQPGNKQIATGYVVHGSSIMLAYAIGYSVHAFTYDPSLGVFCLCQERMRFLEKGRTYSINEGNYIKFPDGVKKYIRFRRGEDRSANRLYTSCYIGPLVVDFHRNLLKGGIYLYPNTASHPDGKLRLLHECNSVVFLAEQAGDKASDGEERIPDVIPEALHQRHSFFVGSDHVVEDIEHFIHEFPDT